MNYQDAFNQAYRQWHASEILARECESELLDWLEGRGERCSFAHVSERAERARELATANMRLILGLSRLQTTLLPHAHVNTLLQTSEVHCGDLLSETASGTTSLLISCERSV
jgi:hypothetical protein